MTQNITKRFQILVFLLGAGTVLGAQNFSFKMPAPNLDVKLISITKALIHWDNLQVEKNIGDFKLHIYRYSDSAGEELAAKLRVNRPYYLDQNLRPGTHYTYKAVFAYQDKSISPYSELHTIITPQVRYSFFVAGHTYGVPGIDNVGFHPPFKDQKEYLKSLPELKLGILTGDIVISCSTKNWNEIDQDIAELKVPVYFSYGNHDYGNRKLLISRYGPTYHSFRYEDDLFIILDSERGPHDITENQLAFIQDQVHNLTPQIKNIFVFSHKLLWIHENTKYIVLQDKINSIEGYNFSSNNFWKDIEPLFHGLKQPVYFFAGDIGVTWAIPAFYDHYSNIHFVASGMGGSPEENYLLVHVTGDDVFIEMVNLGTGDLTFMTIEEYNLDNLDLFSTDQNQPVSLEDRAKKLRKYNRQ